MWNDYYLRADDEAALAAALPDFMKDEDGNIASAGFDFSLDNIGVVGANGLWHANLRLRDGVALPEALAPLLIAAPAFPKRVFY
ncbi:MAG: hypothetical protein H6922_04570 [Pseudomonadaceae bacterium]|nr:hypothetical protein [Pseudomonadaceae bacterium]